MIVAQSGEAVLAPVIGARTRLVMAEIVPRVAVLAIVLADCAPLAFAEVWPPLSPWNVPLARLVEARRFGGDAAFDRVRHAPCLFTDCAERLQEIVSPLEVEADFEPNQAAVQPQDHAPARS